MKKIIYFVLLMLLILIVLPLFIVKGFSFRPGNQLTKVEDNMKVKVYIHTEKITKEMPFEEYLKGVVAAEMPANFEPEALKAQAVAARTYALGRIRRIYTENDGVHTDADVCTDYAHCQAWESKETAMDSWGTSAGQKNWSKIEEAVKETEGIIIVYKNAIVNPVFHSNSGGKTENAEEVWDGVKVPYLRSVVSEGEDANEEYKTTITLKNKEFIEKVKSEYPNIKLNEKDIIKDIKILDYSEGGRVKSIKIGNITLKGTDIRKLLSLRSTNFSIEKEGSDSIKVTVLGNGHGVGMSQWGANYLAKSGKSYEEILKYYYSGIDLAPIEVLEKK